ncbi:MAG: ISAs1 family transposase [Ktedonobacteraceae bacterium]
MYSIAQPAPFSVLTDEQRQQLLQDAHLLSVHEVFAAMPDPRGRHGLRYDLPFLLTCLVAALLCNCNASEAVGQWCREHHDLLRRLFGPRRFLSPCGGLYRWLLPQLSVEALERVLGAWVQATLVASADDPIALDGKTVRGAKKGEPHAPHLLSFRTHRSQETLLQVEVDEKTNEIPVAKALLALLPVQDRVCTADALHTHAAFMQAVHTAHGESLLTVKGNQPTLYADLATYFADPHAIFQEAETVDRRRGRLEVRHIRVSTEMNSYLSAARPLVAQVAEVTRTVTCKGETHTEVIYLITSLTPAQADPHQLLTLIRGHWSIENGSHYVRDVSFGEDRSRIRSGHAPQVMAALRNVALTLMHRLGESHMTATRRAFAFHPQQAFDLLLQAVTAQQ